MADLHQATSGKGGPPQNHQEGTDGRFRSHVKSGYQVGIVQKADQAAGRITEGTVKELLTNSTFHPHGIKVRLTTGEVGRVRFIIRQPS